MGVASLLGVDHWLLLAACIAAFIAIFIAVEHNRREGLCVRCMQQVPADAGPRAQRQQSVLRVRHVTMERPWIMSTVYLVLLGLALGATFDVIDRRWSGAAISFWAAFYFYAIWVHHRLRPWCPYCRDWGEGGDHEAVPDPLDRATA